LSHRKFRVGVSLLVVCAALGARASAAQSLATSSGAELFARLCASCHGESGRGDGPLAGSLKTVPANLTTITRRYGEFPAARIRDMIDGRGLVAEHGTREMPVWGYVLWGAEGGDVTAQRETRDIIAKLVQHIRSLQLD
jgi:mono/diheme cytochrome c family protein